MKTADSLFCGLSTVTWIMFLGKDVVAILGLFVLNFFHLHCIWKTISKDRYFKTWTVKTKTICTIDSTRE